MQQNILLIKYVNIWNQKNLQSILMFLVLGNRFFMQTKILN